MFMQLEEWLRLYNTREAEGNKEEGKKLNLGAIPRRFPIKKDLSWRAEVNWIYLELKQPYSGAYENVKCADSGKYFSAEKSRTRWKFADHVDKIATLFSRVFTAETHSRFCWCSSLSSHIRL